MCRQLVESVQQLSRPSVALLDYVLVGASCGKEEKLARISEAGHASGAENLREKVCWSLLSHFLPITAKI